MDFDKIKIGDVIQTKDGAYFRVDDIVRNILYDSRDDDYYLEDIKKHYKKEWIDFIYKIANK